jgi:integrase
MSIRPHPTKGPGHWYIDLGRGKNRIRANFEGTRDEAKDVELAARKKRGSITVLTDPTLRSITADYLQTYKLDHTPRGYDNQKKTVALLERYFGPYRISSITTALIEQYKIHRLTTAKPTTINKELSALSQICKWSLEAGQIESIPKIKRFPPKLTAPPVLDIPMKVDFVKILDNIKPRYRGLFRLMFFYGLRPGEAFGLRVDNINLSARTLWVKGKGAKFRSIPIMDDDTYNELKERSENAIDGWLWYSARTKGPYVDLRSTLNNAAAAAGVPKIHAHLLRHGAATELVGITDLRSAQAILGHSSIVVTEKYLHVRQHRISAALASHSNNN